MEEEEDVVDPARIHRAWKNAGSQYRTTMHSDRQPWDERVYESRVHRIKDFFRHNATCALNANIRFWDGTTPLIDAVQFNDVETVVYLVETIHADVQYAAGNSTIWAKGSVTTDIQEGMTPLEVAARYGFMRLFQYLLSRGANVTMDAVESLIHIASFPMYNDDRRADAYSLRLVAFLKEVWRRYPYLCTHTSAAKTQRVSWYQTIICGTRFNGMNRLIELFLEMGMIPEITVSKTTSVLEDVVGPLYLQRRRMTPSSINSYIESVRLVYLRCPNNPVEDEVLMKWAKFVRSGIPTQCRERFTELTGLEYTKENVLLVWKPEQRAHRLFYATLLALYSVRIIPRIGQASPIRVLPLDMLRLLMQALYTPRLKPTAEDVVYGPLPPISFDIEEEEEE